jgi:hypothetical protein
MFGLESVINLVLHFLPAPRPLAAGPVVIAHEIKRILARKRITVDQDTGDTKSRDASALPVNSLLNLIQIGSDAFIKPR